MSHEFESGFSVAERMWHGLGNVVQLDDVQTVDGAIDKAGLDWMVRLGAVYCEIMTESGVAMVPIPHRQGVYRERKNAAGELVTVEPADVFFFVARVEAQHQGGMLELREAGAWTASDALGR